MCGGGVDFHSRQVQLWFSFCLFYSLTKGDFLSIWNFNFSLYVVKVLNENTFLNVYNLTSRGLEGKWIVRCIVLDIGLGVRVFANGPVQSQVESYAKTQKMVLDASLLNTQHYKVRIKGKVEQSREGVAPTPTPWCSSYRKGSLRVTLNYGRQLYFTFTLYSVIK